MEAFDYFSGLLVNIAITVCSCIIPILFGVFATIICDKNDGISKALKLFGIIFESICPFIAIYIVFFTLPNEFDFQISAFLTSVVAFTVCFLGYMPLHYDSRYTLGKNLVVNALGLVSIVFKWSFAASVVGVAELLNSTRMMVYNTFDFSIYWVPLIIVFVIIFILELVRFLAKLKLPDKN